jgi:hypothetical protein
MTLGVDWEGLRWVVEDRGNGGDAGVDQAFDAGFGVVEGLESAEALMVRGHVLLELNRRSARCSFISLC